MDWILALSQNPETEEKAPNWPLSGLSWSEEGVCGARCFYWEVIHHSEWITLCTGKIFLLLLITFCASSGLCFSTEDRSKHIKHLHLWEQHEWKLIYHQFQSKINFAFLKQVAQGAEFLPDQFFTGKQACILFTRNTCMHLRTLWSILKSFAWWKYPTSCQYHHRWSIYYREQLIACSNNESMSKCRRIALSRACTNALAFLEHKPVVWSNTNRTGFAFECHWDVAPLLTISALDIWTQKKCDWQPDTLNSLINFLLPLTETQRKTKKCMDQYTTEWKHYALCKHIMQKYFGFANYCFTCFVIFWLRYIILHI